MICASAARSRPLGDSWWRAASGSDAIASESPIAANRPQLASSAATVPPSATTPPPINGPTMKQNENTVLVSALPSWSRPRGLRMSARTALVSERAVSATIPSSEHQHKHGHQVEPARQPRQHPEQDRLEPVQRGQQPARRPPLEPGHQQRRHEPRDHLRQQEEAGRPQRGAGSLVDEDRQRQRPHRPGQLVQRVREHQAHEPGDADQRSELHRQAVIGPARSPRTLRPPPERRVRRVP